MSILYVVATPMGNLEDITLRALKILKDVDLILAEDTRVTSKLLAKYHIKKPLTSYHQHSRSEKINEIVKQIQHMKTVALVTDAGTPGINDPGGMLIEYIVRSKFDIAVVPIPGPNAAITALSISGFPADNFLYLGFPPHKKGRKSFFERVAVSEVTVVFYESRFRIAKALQELPPNREIIVARELTKQFETVYRGKAGEIKIPTEEIKGEFVVVVRA